MEQQKIDRLKEINKRILGCRECTFHQDLLNNNLSYKPDAPCLVPEDAQFKVLSVGLNPGWSKIQNALERKADYQELYQMPIASDDDYDKYVQKLSKLWKMSKGRQPYLDALAKTLFIINKKMGIYDGVNDKEDLKKELYEKYLFWANLSFCNSQNVKNRSFWEAKNISCNVLSEEIPNCLHKGFLKKILNCLKPDIALVFGKYIDPITILKELLGVTPELNQLKSEKHTAHKRNKIDVNVELTTYVPSNQSDIKTKFIFLPHPRFPWNGNCREKAIEWACSMLINIQ